MKEIALHILDIAENSIAAGASRIGISVHETDRLLRFSITDNGCGMDRAMREQLTDPFFTTRTTRRVGMGIPLLQQHTEMTGGGITIRPAGEKGMVVEAVFRRGHPDLQPLGDLEGCWLLLASSNPEIEWSLECMTTLGRFAISNREIMEVLEVDHVGGNELTAQVKELIRHNLELIQLGRELMENKLDRINFIGPVK